MGIYTSNRYFTEAYDWASEIPANEAYTAAVGCAQIMADCQANDIALFESAIYSDFAEVRAFQEGVGYVNENAFTDVIKKIVEMFKKLLAKIKGIFASFIAKLTGAFKNGKDLVKKYEKQILKYSNWKDFKCKGIRKPKANDIQASLNGMISTKTGIVNYTIKSDSVTDYLSTGLDGYATEKQIHDADSSDIRDAILKAYNSNLTDWDKVHEDLMDEFFDEEDTIDGDRMSASFFSENWIKGVLSQEEKWLKDVKKTNEKIEKNINTIIDNLNKDDDVVVKFIANPDNKDKYILGNTERKYNAADSDNKVQKTTYDATAARYEKSGSKKGTFNPEKLQKAIHALQKIAGQEQEVITKLTSEYMTIVKFTLAQSRKLWTAAAAWSSGVHKESVEYAQAIGESSAEQFYMNMEAVC